MSSEILEIDGDFLEGGGQILRMSLSLSCILGRPIRVTKIRANRPNPGLSNQHLYGLNLLAEICKARVTGNAFQSTEIEFHPGAIQAGSYAVDTHTAASVSLVMQAALPVLLYAGQPSSVQITGGTNVSMSPPVDFMSEVFRPNLELFGATLDLDVVRRGYYPRGGGKCELNVSPVRCLKAVDMQKFGHVTEIYGWCFVAGKLPERLSFDMKSAVKQELRQFSQYLFVEAYKEEPNVARDNGSGILLKASTSTGRVLGASVLGKRKVDGREMGQEVSRQLLAYLKTATCVDAYMQDQLILFMALADGESCVLTGELTKHTLTAIHVAEVMTGAQFVTELAPTGHIIIKCRGIGLKNQYFK